MEQAQATTASAAARAAPAAAGPITCQMFELPWMERISRIHPATPFVFWLPVLGWPAARAAGSGLGAPALVGLALAGVLLWTLMEYGLHRFVFHWVGPRPWQRRLHFIMHGVHHDFPSDPQRLVMPLGVSVPMGIATYAALLATLGARVADPVFVGQVLGYLSYDGAHYAIHHFSMRSRFGKWLKRHHMIHHHAGAHTRWGVSSPLWDVVFGTLDAAPRGGGSPRRPETRGAPGGSVPR